MIPDIMLSAPKMLGVSFAPTASGWQWLGPSRNDFHLVGTGRVQVAGTILRLFGRRFNFLVGLPVVHIEELGLQFIVNVESDERALRFELRVPGEKTQALTMWLGSAADTEELRRSLPAERTQDFVPQLKEHVEFERRLIAQVPVPRITYGLIVLNVCIYVTTAIGTNHFLGFDGPSLLPLGSNFGPYTTAGDWWRLFTAMFLHLGWLHLAFNMWALVSFGPMVERLYGSLSYLLIYLVAGVAGGLASLTWHPTVNSVGASGAIFGIFGALFAAQLRHGGSIPKSVLRPLRITSLIYIGFTLFAGLRSTGVDNGAHIGGLCAGLVVGLALARPVTGISLGALALVGRLTPAALVAAILLGAGLWSAQRASGSMVGEALFVRETHWFAAGELRANRKYAEGLARAKVDKNQDLLEPILEHDVLPFWREADDRLSEVELKSNSPNLARLELLQDVADDRLKGYDLLDQGLRKKDPQKIADASKALREVDERTNERVESLREK